MPNKKTLLKKLFQGKITKRELDTLMSKCGCKKSSGGRGSSISYVHEPTGRIVIFDQPHPQKELYRYQTKKVALFLEYIGELED